MTESAPSLLPQTLLERCSDPERERLQAAAELAAGLPAPADCAAPDALAAITDLDQLSMDADCCCAALLLPVALHGHIDEPQVEARFGASAAALLNSLQRLAALPAFLRPGQADAHEGLRKLFLALGEDMRTVIVLLAMRLQTMRRLPACAPERRYAVARETLDLYAPLANRLGIWQYKWELEDLALRHTEPEAYQTIARQLAQRRDEREAFIVTAIAELQTVLAEEGIAAKISGRPKHIYSIWRKMQRKGLPFSELYDIRALRILTDSVRDCYGILGVVHQLWPHIPSEFDDYIAKPKGNNYQSLHTAVVGPGGEPLEVQIRTHAMHQHAEYGVAAHWRYKEGGQRDSHMDDRIAWLRQLLEEGGEGQSEEGDFMDRFKSEIFHDRVYVLTPQGKVIDLPDGATPLDFAYAVHTQVGHRCRGAKVGGSIVPLNRRLANGDQVEILTAGNGEPSRDWLVESLGYLKTSRARNRIRAWFREIDFDQNVADGRQVVERELRRLGISDTTFAELAERFKRPKVDEFFAAIGHGDITQGQLAAALESRAGVQNRTPVKRNQRIAREGSAGRGDIVIEGVGNLQTQIAQCCKPAPPDAIVGYITVGKGVSIHRQDCSNLLHMADHAVERLIDVSWSDNNEQVYPVDLLVYAYDRQGLLRDITNVISDERVNLAGINSSTDDASSTAQMRVTVEVEGVQRLSRLIARMMQVSNVYEVKRV